MSDMRLPWHGGAAIACWAIHAFHHVTRGSAHDLLWACNVAVPLLGAGLLAGARVPCAVALLWLSFGTPIWVLDLATGAGLIVTSPLVHVVAPAIGADAMRRIGWPSHAWQWASAAIVALLGVSRVVGSPGPNVNLAFRIHPGWERQFGSHTLLLAVLLAASTLVFFLVDRLVRRGGRRRSGRGAVVSSASAAGSRRDA
jgi:hypothetical protein